MERRETKIIIISPNNSGWMIVINISLRTRTKEDVKAIVIGIG